MPEIKRFGGFRLLMFFQDWNPAHIHITAADFAAKVRISNGEVLAGMAPGKVLRQARAWIGQHRDELMTLWEEFQG